MKFGEQLLSHLTPEWSSQYIQYEYMKEMLLQAVAAAPALTTGGDNVLREQYFLRTDESFTQYCEKQLTKINTFFAEKLAEALRRFETLKDELQFTKSVQEQASHRKPSISVIQEANGIVNFNGDTTAMKNPGQRPSLIAPLFRMLPDRLVKNTDEQRKQHMHYKNTTSLKVAFSEFYLMLTLLQRYQLLNFTGFRKILKKHDKLFQTTRGDEWRKLHIDTATFYTSTAVTELIRDVETIYTDGLESGDRARAMKRLRVPPLEEKQSPVVTFRVGIFIGMLCLLLPMVLAFIIFLNKSQSGKPLAWREALVLYRSTFLIILQIIFSGINVYGWTSSGVNHILIFEIDPRHHLVYQQLLEIGTFLSVIWFLSFLGFILMSYVDFYPFVQPLIFLILICLFLINPAPILYRPARYWFLRKLARVFSAPFHPVGFTDFWLGDQFTSLELTFFDIEYFFCFYFSDHQWWSTNLTTTTTVKGVFCTGWTRILLQIFLLMLPSWFRFAQCLRRYRDTKHGFPHLANAGKYATGFFVAITNSLRRGTTDNYLNNKLANPYLYTWIIASLVSSTYKLIWDLKMDWGFFDKNAGENKYLRSQIVYSKIYYYAVIIEDILCRYIWIINIFIHFHTPSAEYADVIGFAFGLIELFRRFLWNFFRLENEHLNNCGQFRAVRDISITPISTGFDFALIESKLNQQPGIRQRHRTGEDQIMTNEEDMTTTDGRTMDESENYTAIFIENQMSTCDTTTVLDINEINANLRGIASKRRHTLSSVLFDSNPSYPILRVNHLNRLLKHSKSV